MDLLTIFEETQRAELTAAFSLSFGVNASNLFQRATCCNKCQTCGGPKCWLVLWLAQKTYFPAAVSCSAYDKLFCLAGQTSHS